MALIDCPECGSSISDKAPACPKCGNPGRIAAPASPPQAAASPPTARRAWYHHSAFVALMLFVVAPVGALLMWTQSPRSPFFGGFITRSLITLFFVSFWCSSYLGARRETLNARNDSLVRASLASTSTPPTSEAAHVESRPIEIAASKYWQAYQANEVAADEAFKGRALLVTGNVATVGKTAFGGLTVSLQSPNEFMPVNASVNESEKGKVSALSKGDRIRILCTGGTMIIGHPHLTDCTLR